jgi:hypothetical protein
MGLTKSINPEAPAAPSEGKTTVLDQETLEVPATAESQSASSTPRRDAKAPKPVEPHLLSAHEV